MKHRYDSAARDDSSARRERLRRVVDDIAYALYKGKMATAARVSRPYVASANRAWLSAEFITPTQQQQRGAPSRRGLAESRRGLAESRRGLAESPPASPGKWHTKKQRRVASPPRQSHRGLAESSRGLAESSRGLAESSRFAESPPAPKPRAPMNSESNDEFFARAQIQRRRSPS